MSFEEFDALLRLEPHNHGRWENLTIDFAVALLTKFGPSGWATAVESFPFRPSWWRWRFVEALRETGLPERALPILIELLRDQDIDVAIAAVESFDCCLPEHAPPASTRALVLALRARAVEPFYRSSVDQMLRIVPTLARK